MKGADWLPERFALRSDATLSGAARTLTGFAQRTALSTFLTQVKQAQSHRGLGLRRRLQNVKESSARNTCASDPSGMTPGVTAMYSPFPVWPVTVSLRKP